MTGKQALCLLLLFLIGCGPASTPIQIGVRTANDHVPFYIADREGMYRQAGLTVQVRLVPSNTEIIEALQRGDFQMSAVPAPTAIAAIDQGAHLRIVAMTGRGSDGLLVRADGGIARWEDLRGKRIATIRASILDILLRQALERHGLDPERDVTLVYFQKLGDMVSALKTRQVEATSNTEPFMTDAVRQGWGYILGYYTEQWPDHPCCVVLAREDFLHGRPDVPPGTSGARPGRPGVRGPGAARSGPGGTAMRRQPASWCGLLLPAGLLLVWEMLPRLGVVDSVLLPPFSRVAERLGTLAFTGALWPHRGASLGRVLLGYALAVAVALPLGFSLGLNERAEPWVRPLVQALRPLAPPAWIPLAILWFGIGNAPAVFIISSAPSSPCW